MLIISALYIFDAPNIFGYLIGLTKLISSEVFFKRISSDQVELLQSFAVLFFATSDDEGTGYFIIGGRNGFCPRLRLHQFRLPVSRRFPYLLPTGHLMELGRLEFLRGVEGIRGVGSVSRLLQVLTLIRMSGILAPI